jgi:guanylate kinase
MLVVISGPSGSGKTSIVRALLGRLNFRRSVSATTRPIREGEVNGTSYHFLSRKEFEDRVAQGGFLEFAEYAGQLYGTPRRPVEEALSRGETILLEIEVQGARSVRKAFPDAVTVFVQPPSPEEARRRLLDRHREGEAEIARRMEIAQRELACAGEFDHQVVNDDLEAAIAETVSIIGNEQKRRGL